MRRLARCEPKRSPLCWRVGPHIQLRPVDGQVGAHLPEGDVRHPGSVPILGAMGTVTLHTPIVISHLVHPGIVPNRT